MFWLFRFRDQHCPRSRDWWFRSRTKPPKCSERSASGSILQLESCGQMLQAVGQTAQGKPNPCVSWSHLVPKKSSFCKALRHVLRMKKSTKKVNTVAKHSACQPALQASWGWWLLSALPVLVLLTTPPTSFFIQFLWTVTFQTQEMTNLLFCLAPLAATSGWEMRLTFFEEKRQWIYSNRDHRSSSCNGYTKSSSTTWLSWTTPSGNTINNKLSLSQHYRISILHPNAFSLSKWHSDVFWDTTTGICQDTCWLLQTETHGSSNLV